VIQKPAASISQLTFSGGNVFELKPTEKIILVGPNNSGKSQSLREIESICKDGKKVRPFVVVDLKMTKVGTVADLKGFLETDGVFVNDHYRYKNWQIHSGHIANWSNEFLLHGLSPGFIKNIAASDRLTICNQQRSISPDEQKSKPQHVLYDDAALMSRVSGLFRRAFGMDLMFDFRGGSQIPIHVGEIPSGEGSIDRVSDAYVRAIRGNPRLDQQGDGIKSYAGILFEAVVADLDITDPAQENRCRDPDILISLNEVRGVQSLA
jgi:hypothetical protein